jgi:hypothetical protein
LEQDFLNKNKYRQMKLTSYTITLEDLVRDLEELIEIKKSVGKEALEEGNWKMVNGMRKDIIEIRAWLNDFYLKPLMAAWCEWEPFAEKILNEYPDVSDILLIIDNEPGKFIIKHWLRNRMLHNPTEEKNI